MIISGNGLIDFRFQVLSLNDGGNSICLEKNVFMMAEYFLKLKETVKNRW